MPSLTEPADIFEKRALLALVVAGYFQMPVETALAKSTDALEGLATTATRDLAYQLRQRLWQATLAANAQETRS